MIVVLIGEARRDINGPYDQGYTHLSFDAQKYINLSEYSLRAHTTALWRINKITKELEWIFVSVLNAF